VRLKTLQPMIVKAGLPGLIAISAATVCTTSLGGAALVHMVGGNMACGVAAGAGLGGAFVSALGSMAGPVLIAGAVTPLGWVVIGGAALAALGGLVATQTC
jgi:hypothetical protein